LRSAADVLPAPVVLLHGLGGCSFDWEHVAVAAGSAPAVAIDAPYHGGRPAQGPLTFDALARDTLHAVDALGFDRFILVGLSMGAATALTVMSLAPHRVLGAALVAPAWLDEPEPPNLRSLQRIGRLIARRGLTDAWTVQASLPPLSTWSDLDRLAHRIRYLEFDPDAVAQALIELPGRLPRLPRLLDASARHLGNGAVKVVSWPGDQVHPRPLAARTAEVLGVPLVDLETRPADRVAEAAVHGRIIGDLRRCVDAAMAPSPADGRPEEVL